MFEKVAEISKSKKGLYFVLFLSLLIKVLTVVIINDMAINRDGEQYIAAAQQFAQWNFREGLGFCRMPLYPILIMLVHFIVRNWLIAARLVSIGSMILAIIPLYMITKDLFNRKAAFWASFAFSLSPEPSQLAMEVLRDPVYILLMLWAVYFSQKAIQEKKMNLFFFAAAFSFIPFLARVEGIIFPPFYFLFFVCLTCVFVFNPQERSPYMKGLLVPMFYSLFVIFAFLLLLGSEKLSFNKIDVITREIQKITEFRIGENYNAISKQLKILEKMSPYSSGKQHFAEVARHFMPLIYLLGLLEVLIKNIFVFYLIPLIWGLKFSISRTRLFVISFALFYILIIFYTYIESDFIQTRFLLVPALLFYPWIGLGLDRIWSAAKSSSYKKGFLVVFIVIFFVLPIGKYAKGVANHGGAIYNAGEWIKTNEKFKEVKFYTNDSRVGFHAGQKLKEYIKVVHKFERQEEKQGITLEQFATQNDIELIAIMVSRKKADSSPTFVTYKKIKEFRDRKKIVMVYCSPALYQEMGIK